MHFSLITKRRYRFIIIPRYKQTLAVELQSTNNNIGHYLDEKRVQSIGMIFLNIFIQMVMYMQMFIVVLRHQFVVI